MKTLLKILTLFIALGAIGGAVMMWYDPSGESWGGAPMLDLLRAKMPGAETLFKDFVPSGFVLLAVNGLPQLLAAVMLFKNHPWAYRVVFACGVNIFSPGRFRARAAGSHPRLALHQAVGGRFRSYRPKRWDDNHEKGRFRT